MTLKELPVGKSGLITAVGGEGILRCRLPDPQYARDGAEDRPDG